MPSDFAQRVFGEVDTTAASLLKNLAHPVGRQPGQSDMRLAAWINELSVEDKKNVTEIVRYAVHVGVFQLMAILDGANAVRQQTEESLHFELAAIQGATRFLLTAGRDGSLNEAYPLAAAKVTL